MDGLNSDLLAGEVRADQNVQIGRALLHACSIAGEGGLSTKIFVADSPDDFAEALYRDVRELVDVFAADRRGYPVAVAWLWSVREDEIV